MRKIAAIITTMTAGIVISLGAASRATAATITWGAATTISATSDVDTTGDLQYAYDMGLSSGTVTVNTVPFKAWAPSGTSSQSEVTSPNATLALDASGGSFSGAGGSTPGGSPAANLLAADSSYWNLIDTEAYAVGGDDTLTLTLNNLMSGHRYEFEMWVDDSRDNTLYLRTDTVSTTGGPSVVLSFDANPVVYTPVTNEGDGVGQFVIGTFTAGAASQSILIAGNQSAQIGAFEVREIPEPASLALLGVGVAAVVVRRNRSKIAR